MSNRTLLVTLLSLVSSFALGTPGGALASPRKKILVLVSSARSLPLASPSEVPEIPVGFFLVELAKMLQTYEATSDFVFATPDGRAPVIDTNGLDLDFHIQGGSAPFANLGSNLSPLPQSPAQARASHPGELARRAGELQAAIRHLGRVELSEPVARTSPEAREFRVEAQRALDRAPRKDFLSFRQVLARGDLTSYDFIYIPGGHAPMVDLRDNAELGEILNRFHDAGGLIAAICHGPIALQSAQYRIDSAGRARKLADFPLKGARVTTVSSFEEKLMLDVGYVHVPDVAAPTRLEYFVDEALKDAGYRVEYGSPMILGVQALPAQPHVVYDSRHQVLTSNGPQTMDEMMIQLRKLK